MAVYLDTSDRRCTHTDNPPIGRLARSATLILALFALATNARADFNYEYYEGSWNSLPNFSALTPVATGTTQGFDIGVRLRDDQFGFRFTGTINAPGAGVYTFATNSDDGSRLWIDGTLVVDNDGLHAPVQQSGTISLAGGDHSIVVTFFEQGGGQVLDVTYAPPGGGLRAIPADGQLDGPDSPATVGQWGSVISWPHVPVSAANLPDGRVLTWASNERTSFPGSVGNEFTFTGVWDPATNVVSEFDRPNHDMFCAHQVMLEDGKVFVSGGRNQENTPFTSVFDHTSNQWLSLNNMNRGRWYPTSLALADGTVFTAIGSGGSNTGEVYRPQSGDWQLLTGIDFNPMILNYPSSSFGERNWWPLLHLAPNGQVFHSGPTPQMHMIDTSGLGTATPVGNEFDDWYTKHGATVMYDEGMLLTAGGWTDGDSVASTNQAITIDINGPVPVIATTNPMQNARKFHNGVMLPNGDVLMVGGNTSGLKFNDSGSVFQTEVWNPTTGQWTTGAASSVPRNYHSIALLLTDGRVLSAGGGLCNCSADHSDGQVYSPPYLFNGDGSLATRPQIDSAPAVIRAGDQFAVATDSTINHFSLIKMSSTTHGVNSDLRYLSVPFTGSGGNYQLTVSSNPNVLTPGYWMLFAINTNGTPSVAKVVQVQSANTQDPPAVPAIDVSYASLADLSEVRLNGDASGTLGRLRLTPNSANQAGSGFYRTPFAIGPDSSFATSFEFSMSGTGDGGSGMAFVVQGNSSSALGGTGGGLGYSGIPNSLIVELDTFDSGSGDIDANHVAVHTNGDSGSALASAAAPFDLEDGVTHRIWVDYSGPADTLDVYVAQSAGAAKPASPLLSLPGTDLPSIVGLQGNFGFTGATGSSGSSNNHDVHSWSLAASSGGGITIDPVVADPQSGSGPVQFDVSASGTGLEYSWSFGDGSAATSWSSNSAASHNYSSAGRYTVTVTVRDVNGNEELHQFVQAVYDPLTSNAPQSSSGIIYESVSSPSGRVWNVNPDNDTVTLIRASGPSKQAEIGVGDEPRSLGLAPDGTLWVVNKGSDTISIIDTGTLSVVSTRQLPSGSRAHGLVFDPESGFAYVALEALGRVLKLDVYSNTVLDSVTPGGALRHLSLTADRSKLYVSRFITPPLAGESGTNPQTGGGGEVVAVSTSTMNVSTTVVLKHSNRSASELSGPGFPNYLGPAVVSPSGLTAWVASKQDNVLLGSSRNGDPLNHDHTVRAVTSVFTVANDQENLSGRVDHDNASVASNGAFGPYGVYLFTALEGNRQVAVIDVYANEELLRFDTGFAPQSVAVSDDGNTVYVHNFMGRSVTVADATALMDGQTSVSVPVVATISTVSNESLSSQVLTGKRLFYDAADPRLADESYMACASCHNEGGHDGRVWDLTSMGEGVRNTISLKGHSGTGQGRLHWTANFDEVQDFENQIRSLAGGTGLMSNADFTANEAPLGSPKAGLSNDLDALAAYVGSLTTFGVSPERASNGSLTAAGEAGKALFESEGCATCHSGNGFTDSSSGAMHDVGTLTAASGQRAGGALTALDTPTLKGLWETGPYLHDGSEATVAGAIAAHSGVSLTSAQLSDLEAYLLQIDDNETQGGGGSGAFQQGGNGLLVMEAENYDAQGGSAAGPWTEVNNEGSVIERCSSR